ncbi:hypothetical protein KDU71_12565 [Carboxylicivirga sediminis]|uniref:Uncharacterized protein n=1 Tax=Carboxylicivirga sediminis TaxID=2006564 RepID=A0A941IZ32_9BACT|nr:hypothetical protein [Carboxylicivirga sediminis]MBR8536397.1 hypothetical protein [Carboxylicivirga sediminis]
MSNKLLKPEMCREITDKEINRLIKKREEENKVFKKLLKQLESTNKKANKKKLR